MLRTLRDWLGRTMTPTEPLEMPYADATVARRNDLQREHQDVSRRLAQEHIAWEKLKERADPEAYQARAAIAPRIIDLKADLDRLSGAIAAAEKAVLVNRATVTEYAQLVTDTEAWLRPLLEALPSDDVLARAYETSRRLDSLSRDLLGGTGDRKFRRAAVDPLSALREAISDRQRALERVRWLRSSVVPNEKTAS